MVAVFRDNGRNVRGGRKTYSLKNSSSDLAYFSANFLNDLSLINAISVLSACELFLRHRMTMAPHGSIMRDLVFLSSY